jgi:hypothetical protein
MPDFLEFVNDSYRCFPDNRRSVWCNPPLLKKSTLLLRVTIPYQVPWQGPSVPEFLGCDTDIFAALFCAPSPASYSHILSGKAPQSCADQSRFQSSPNLTAGCDKRSERGFKTCPWTRSLEIDVPGYWRTTRRVMLNGIDVDHVGVFLTVNCSISFHSRPWSSRPPAFGVRPPHCLKK